MAIIKPHVSIKHAIIDKANAAIVIAISLAVFVLIFSIFSVKALISQSLYQNRVISAKNETLKILESNHKAANNLEIAYSTFNSGAVNVLGGDSSGSGLNGGDNAQIVLDALPSEYDYPALSSSIEKILLDGGYQIKSIGGTEDSSQTSTTTGTQNAVVAGDSETVEIPYPFSITANTENTVNLLKTLESSIRPFYVTSLTIRSSGLDNLDTTIGLKTFYKPASGMDITSKVVK